MGVVSADVSDSSIVEQLTEYIQEVGVVDVLVNCAGITYTAPMSNTPVQKYQVRGYMPMWCVW